jgi:hypothetical protein
MAPHITKIRPPTEPYEIHRARQKVQQRDMKEYLRGRVVWRSCILIPTSKHHGVKTVTKQKGNGGTYERVPFGMTKVKVEGTYVMPLCPLCLHKDKHCICLEGL